MQFEFKGYSLSGKTGAEIQVAHVCVNAPKSVINAVEANIPDLPAVCASWGWGLMRDENPDVVEIVAPRSLAGRYVWVEGEKKDTWEKEAARV